MDIQNTFSLRTTVNGKESSAEIVGVIPKEKIRDARTAVLERLREERKNIDGFRDGTAPLEVVERTVGSLEVWRMSAHEVFMKHFPEMAAAEGVVPLGSPRLQFSSVPINGDVSFRVGFAVMPKVDLPDYGAIAETVTVPEEPGEVSGEEVAGVVTQIRRDLYRRGNPEGDLPSDENLPELTDATVREISNEHTDVAGFLSAVRASVLTEKRNQVRNTFRTALLDAIIAESSITLPDLIIEEDAARAYRDFEHQAEHFGTTVGDYLRERGMTEEELRRQMRDEAEKRARMQLVMNAISMKEHLHADAAEVDREVARFRQRQDNTMPEGQIRTYVESMLTNEKVLQFLEQRARGHFPEQSAGERPAGDN